MQVLCTENYQMLLREIKTKISGKYDAFIDWISIFPKYNLNHNPRKFHFADIDKHSKIFMETQSTKNN